MYKPLRIYDVSLAHKNGGSFDFVVLADNKEHAKRIVKSVKRRMGYTRIDSLKFSAVNDGTVFERFPNEPGVY